VIGKERPPFSLKDNFLFLFFYQKATSDIEVIKSCFLIKKNHFFNLKCRLGDFLKSFPLVKAVNAKEKFQRDQRSNQP
jgi:hypothetical protein